MGRKKKDTRASPRKPFDPPGASPLTSADEEVGTGFFGTFSSLDALAALALGLLVAVSYFPALSGGFIWDDQYFAEQPVIHKTSGLLNIWFSPADIEHETHYWPLVYTSFWLEHKLWGLAPLGYHLVNVLLHVVNCLLVWRLLRRLAVPGAWAIAAVFAVHPLHVESVAWIIERKDLLSALFYLTAVLTWLRFVEAPGWGRYGLALALFTAGLLSKSVVVTLPAALLIWHWWQQARITTTDLLRLGPFFLVGLGITAADFSFYTSREPLALGYSPIERVLIAAHALWFYVGKLLWPTDLAVIYPLWDIRVEDPLAWAYVVAGVTVAALLWFGRHRMGRGPLAGALFFTVTLSPMLGFVDYGYMQYAFVADRFQYLAGIGVMAVLIGAAVHGAGKLPGWSKWAGGALAVVIVVLLGTLTWRQAGIYRDEMTFFSHVVALNPDARSAHFNLGAALIKAGRPEEALAAARLAVEKRPNFAGTHFNLGLVLSQFKRFAEAEEHLRRALELDPRHRKAHLSMAETLRRQERYEEAVAAYRAVLKLDPRHRNARQNMAETLRKQERYEEAVAAYRAVLKLDPRHRNARQNMAETLRKQERYEEAVAAYRAVLAVDPDFALAHAGLGVTLYYLGRPKEALRSFERALALDPNLTGARTGLEKARKILRQRGQQGRDKNGETEG